MGAYHNIPAFRSTPIFSEQGPGESTELLSLEMSPPHHPRDAHSLLLLLACPTIPQPEPTIAPSLFLSHKHLPLAQRESSNPPLSIHPHPCFPCCLLVWYCWPSPSPTAPSPQHVVAPRVPKGQPFSGPQRCLLISEPSLPRCFPGLRPLRSHFLNHSPLSSSV